MKKVLRRFWVNWLKPVLIVVLVTTSIRSALADWNDVPTGSMKPTILEGDRVFVNKLAFDLKVPYTTWHLAEWGNPRRGDIVVFYSPADGKRLVKRVIGLPGDTLALRDNQLVVNGEQVAYTPLAQPIIDEIPAARQSQHQFATELLGSRNHPVMATSQLPAPRSFASLTVPADAYFMMGDNRDNSFDSRFYGCVPRKQILGRVPAVALSFDPERYYLPRWHRWFTALP